MSSLHMSSMALPSPRQKVFSTSHGLYTYVRRRARHQMASLCITRDPNFTASSQVLSSAVTRHQILEFRLGAFTNQ